MCDPLEFEAIYDERIASEEMSPEYQNKLMRILCNDCLIKSNVKYHSFGGKCMNCRSYNTTRIGNDLIDADTPNATENKAEEKKSTVKSKKGKSKKKKKK